MVRPVLECLHLCEFPILMGGLDLTLGYLLTQLSAFHIQDTLEIVGVLLVGIAQRGRGLLLIARQARMVHAVGHARVFFEELLILVSFIS